MRDFASIVNAVKPQKQTALYKVLGALYSLGALDNPVTTDEITRTILLQFGKNGIPVNLSAKLTQLKKYVRRESLGRPIKWRLIPAGLEKLSKMSGLDLSTETNSFEYLCDVGIICALEQPEFSAVVAATGGDAAWRVIEEPRLAHVYRECGLTTTSGKALKVIGTTSSSMGLTAASIVDTAHHAFPPSHDFDDWDSCRYTGREKAVRRCPRCRPQYRLHVWEGRSRRRNP